MLNIFHVHDGIDHRCHSIFLQVGLDLVSERTLVGANDLTDLLAVLEEHESGHGSDVELLGEVGDLVDVDLVEFRLVLELLAELDHLWGDHLARPAPGGEAVEHDELVRGADRGIERDFAVDFINAMFLGRSRGGEAALADVEAAAACSLRSLA